MGKIKLWKSGQMNRLSFYLSVFVFACCNGTTYAQKVEKSSLFEGTGYPSWYASSPNQLYALNNVIQKKYDYPEYPSSNATLNKQNNFGTEKNYGAFIQTGLVSTTDGLVPFWMRSLQYGSIPYDGFSGYVLAGAHKNYNKTRKQLLDWGASFEGRFNAKDSKNEFLLIEGYLKGRISMFEVKGGRFKEFMGLVDSTLSSGAFSISGNALGIPKVEIGFPEYWDIPFTDKVLAIKWNLSHGWFGEYQYHYYGMVNAYYHQKSLYGRLGKPNWKVKLYGGMNHQVMWGGEDEVYAGRGWNLSNWETFKYVFWGKPYGEGGVPTSKIGNHLGSIDQAITYDIKDLLFSFYHQFYYEAGALAKLANTKDGLWGFSIQNKSAESGRIFRWNKILFEFMYSKSQGGEPDSKPRPSGFEDYYNNSYYIVGWVYEGENMGTPFLTQDKYVRDELPNPKSSYQNFSNNRVRLFHLGSEFSLARVNIKALLSYSQNFGNYTTSPAARGRGTQIKYYPPPYFGQQNQISGYLEAYKKIKNGFELGFKFAFDSGDLLYNATGCEINLTKRW